MGIPDLSQFATNPDFLRFLKGLPAAQQRSPGEAPVPGPMAVPPPSPAAPVGTYAPGTAPANMAQTIISGPNVTRSFWNPNARQEGGATGGFDISQIMSGKQGPSPMLATPTPQSLGTFQAFAQGAPMAGGAGMPALSPTTALEQTRKMFGVAPGYEAAWMANNPDFAKAMAGQQQSNLLGGQLGLEQQKFGLEQEKQKWLMSDEGKAFALASGMLQSGVSADRMQRALENLGFNTSMFGKGGAGAGAGAGGGGGGGAGAGAGAGRGGAGEALSRGFPKDVRNFLEDEVGPKDQGPPGKEGGRYTVNAPMDAMKQLIARFPPEYITQNLPGLINYLVQRFPGVDVRKELLGPNWGIPAGSAIGGGTNPTEDVQSMIRNQLGLEQKRSWAEMPARELFSGWQEPKRRGQAEPTQKEQGKWPYNVLGGSWGTPR